MLELIICGIDGNGIHYPHKRYMGDQCIGFYAAQYLKEFSTCIRLMIDVALPVVDYSAQIRKES